MDDGITVVVALALWTALQIWVLPRLGVAT